MTNDIIQVKYDKLQEVAARFGRQAEAAAQMEGRVQQSLRALQAGGWEGRGATAFFGEMNGTVLPSLGRLGAALQQSQQATRQIVQVLRAAEEEASRPFHGAGPGGAGQQEGVGFWGGVGDFFRGAGAELKDMATGLWNMVTDPVGTAKGLWYGITHPGELWDAIKQPYVEAWESGHPWEAIGRGTVAVVTTLLGTKGADKASKLLKGTTVADDVARAGSVMGDAGRVASTVEDVGRLVNNTGRVISEAESNIAGLLVQEGKVVEIVAEGTTRTADFLVNGVPTELKTVSKLTSSDLSAALSRRILDGAGQAGNIIIDARGQAGLTRELAEIAIRRAYGADKLARLKEIRIIGEGFDITIPATP